VSILASSLALGAADYSWRDHALCRDTDPELFFPVGTTGIALVQIDKARQVCRECTVRGECLEYALDTNQDSGIWGGLSEEERRVIRRQRRGRHQAAQTAEPSVV
jgi:WhiB family redox-sensing transcriptional regulator